MRRRCNDSSGESTPKKRSRQNSLPLSINIKSGTELKDITGKQWKLGKSVGVGGFGEIYLASDNLSKDVNPNSNYVAKLERHTSGPLFVEMNCYLRIAKQKMIEEWKQRKDLKALGMPHYVASGSHFHKGERYRFLILPKFQTDLEQVLTEKKVLNIKTVLTIATQIINVLEYIHCKGYIHSDIKASNILLSKMQIEKDETDTKMTTLPVRTHLRRTCNLKIPLIRNRGNLRPLKGTLDYNDNRNKTYLKAVKNVTRVIKKEKEVADQIYLLDYGLAAKFLTSNGKHKPFCIDQRKAHAGTVLYCSRDAHNGVSSRRSDLESLGYNIIYWLTGDLPWWKNTHQPEVVHKAKENSMTNLKQFLKGCFVYKFDFLRTFFKYIQQLEFQEKPDYDFCRRLFQGAIHANGYRNDNRFDFENKKMQFSPKKSEKEVEEFRNIMYRSPLKSNIYIRPLLRKKVKDERRVMKWSKILVDPEGLLKQGREKKNEDYSPPTVPHVENININRLNPTYAMLEVYNKCNERGMASPTYKGDCFLDYIEGYTPIMMEVYNKMKKRRDLELELAVENTAPKRRRPRGKLSNKSKGASAPSPLKSKITLKREQARKTKHVSPKRTYSLRG